MINYLIVNLSSDNLEVTSNLFGAFLVDCSKELQSTVEHEFLNGEKSQIVVKTNKVKELIDLIYEHKTYPREGFEEMLPDQIDVTLEGSGVNFLQEYIRLQENIFNKQQLNIIDFIISDMIREQEELSTRLKGIEEFIATSGVAHFQTFFALLLENLEEAELISMNQATKNMFITKH